MTTASRPATHTLPPTGPSTAAPRATAPQPPVDLDALRARAVPGVTVGPVDTRGLNSWIEVSASAVARNLTFFRSRVGAEVELSSVVKSNAYGHGRREMALLAAAQGADSFCVHALEEALDLRASGFAQDILIMGHVPLQRLDEAVEGGFRLVLYNRESAERLAALTTSNGRRVRVHLKVETGTHRQGVDGAALDALLEVLARHRTPPDDPEAPGLDVEGVYTHFADIEDTTDSSYAEHQLQRFGGALERLAAAGFRPRCRHTACSAASLVLPSTRFDMVRLGIGQYGFWSSRETLASYRTRHGAGARDALQPVLAWKTRISQLKTVPADAYVGYGCSWQATRETRLAILPIGYADGYDRRLSSSAHVLVAGRRAPVRGRVCMNLTMVDVTDIPGVELEDEVVLLGRQGERTIHADELASIVGTIHYEIVTRLGAHLPRIIVG
ncbi:MAG: alanine racemase [Acidobacteriota bacterium]